jgi:eukaryotic-like serine/threonine-protein kinase
MHRDPRADCVDDEIVAQFFDGDLEAEDEARLRTHVDACDECRQLLAVAGQSDRAVPQVPAVTDLAAGGSGAANPFRPGALIAEKYEVLRSIGVGGMGIVLAARHRELGQIVAIKAMLPENLGDGDAVRRFLREGRAAAALRSDNIVRIYDVGLLPSGLPFLVMEFLEGEDLASRLRTGPIRVNEAIDYVVQAAAALIEAHGRGLIHRDIKPQNLFLARVTAGRRRIKVLDFGLAKQTRPNADPASTSQTRERTILGSPYYMSPEQVRGAPDVDVRTDVWSLGVTLFQLLAGSPPFTSTSVHGVLARILADPAPDVRSLRPDTPKHVAEVIARCLEQDREKRYASIDAFVTALQAAAPAEHGKTDDDAPGDEPTVQMRAAPPRPNAKTTLVMSAATPPPPAPWSGRPPRPLGPHPTPIADSTHPDATLRWVICALAVAAMAAALSAVLFSMRRDGRGATPIAVRTALRSVQADAGDVSPSPDAGACAEGTVFIPGGRFFMGSDDDLPPEKPAHNVTVRAFCMDRREVTTDAYRACSDRGDCKRAGVTNRFAGMTPKDHEAYDPLCNAQATGHGTHPINCVDWSMADRFCRSAGTRLPTEAEWEFAARGSDGRKYPWGDTPPTAKHLNACGLECGAWLKERGAQLDGLLYAEGDGWATTAPVGSFPAGTSQWGVEDIVGNVWEWVADYYAPYTALDQVDPVGPTAGAGRVIRGGSWNGAHPDWVRPSFRYQSAPDTRSHGIGFRCVRPL